MNTAVKITWVVCRISPSIKGGSSCPESRRSCRSKFWYLGHPTDGPVAEFFLQLSSQKDVELHSDVVSGGNPPWGSTVHGRTLQIMTP